MMNPIKKLATLNGKKRYIFLALFATEVLSLPAAAQIVQRVSFESRPMVTAVEIPTKVPGLSRYLVTSNAGFGIQSVDLDGDVMVQVKTRGSLGGSNRFGDSAQLPGPQIGCASVTGPESNIYLADQKIAAAPGSPPDQAVVFEFSYNVDAKPKFDFIAGDNTESVIEPCSEENQLIF